MRPEGEWNDYHITAIGQHMILRINGQVSTELIDREEGHYDLSGILGLQLRSGDPMTVQEPSASCTGSCSTCGGCH